MERWAYVLLKVYGLCQHRAELDKWMAQETEDRDRRVSLMGQVNAFLMVIEYIEDNLRQALSKEEDC